MDEVEWGPRGPDGPKGPDGPVFEMSPEVQAKMSYYLNEYVHDTPWKSFKRFCKGLFR